MGLVPQGASLALLLALVVAALLIAQGIERRVSSGPVLRFVPTLERFARRAIMLALLALGSILLSAAGEPVVAQFVTLVNG